MTVILTIAARLQTIPAIITLESQGFINAIVACYLCSRESTNAEGVTQLAVDDEVICICLLRNLHFVFKQHKARDPIKVTMW
jgi:hypothetical protein